jgi:hypothetical protein
MLEFFASFARPRSRLPGPHMAWPTGLPCIAMPREVGGDVAFALVVLKTPYAMSPRLLGGGVCCPHAIELQYFRRGERSIMYAHLVELAVSMIGDTIIDSDE